MPEIDDPPPDDIKANVIELRKRLDTIPHKWLDHNLLIGTWNIRAFGDLTKEWHSQEGDSPKRDFEAVLYIKEIISRFDVVAVQEVRGNIRALRYLLKALGEHWGFILTDVTAGKAGNDERMAYLYDTRRVKPSGLAGELVIPEEWLKPDATGQAAMQRQFARTPYAVSFVSGNETFILVTLHVIYGTGAADRVEELQAIAKWLADWARQEKSWGHNLIALGDFNIDRNGDANYQAFTSTGLTPAPELTKLPRTIFKSGKSNFFDQIAWFTDAQKAPILSLRYNNAAGNFDFVSLYPSLDETEISWRISDHYPLWVEFAMDGG